MVVTFISECEKKALPKTRRVLDVFANRIGQRTWQTVITAEGLQAVKKLLRKTANKNTAVSCHWIRSRSHTELMWIVGNRQKFDAQGFVAVNYTRSNSLQLHLEDDWHYLPLIKALTSLAALFHDWGKSSAFFQHKLQTRSKKGDPLRHEWISALLFQAYVAHDQDEQWLERLGKGELDSASLKQQVLSLVQASQGKTRKPAPLDKLPSAAGCLNWLILSHHRLPVNVGKKGYKADTFSKLLRKVRQDWGYEHNYDNEAFQQNLPHCFDFPHGLPSDAKRWRKEARKYAQKLQSQLPRLQQAIENGVIRSVLLHSRLALMLGDHYYSSLDAADDRLPYRELSHLHANTDKHGQLKQSLDEHLLGVKKYAVDIAHKLPLFEAKYEDALHAKDTNQLRKKSAKAFAWQDTAVSKIKIWRKQHTDLDKHQFGFFAVNMASTGKGKTFANAKIMRALSADESSLRYVLALGLRTLTLQTGDEYRERIGLKDDELAVLIGSKAILDLHQQANDPASSEEEQFLYGSESEASLLDNEVDYDTAIPNENLATVLRTNKEKKFLYAPVLSCTIDHLMAATETKRGGRYILPTLRLMSSDLVIDEIDDFDGTDLIAIGRLIHLAGMLGRKVMISSATIPPNLAQGYFNAYQAGWKIFATMREKPLSVACAWIDEKATLVHDIAIQNTAQAQTNYQTQHEKFVAKRIAFLARETVKRKATIVPCDADVLADESSKRRFFFQQIQQAISTKHQQHNTLDPRTQKHVSFGVVRMANIDPCVALSHYLLNADWDEGIDVRIMTYHSQQVLLMRHAQEQHLDEVLKRKTDNPRAANQHPIVQQHLQNSDKSHVIFILVATPVEEVGRDHDFDWAVVEPSSYRSFIQLAGRVLRHRQQTITQPNIALLQFNLKGLLGKQPAFNRPGYETKELTLNNHDLNTLVDTEQLAQCLDAAPRVQRNAELSPQHKLADLEHESIHRLLTDDSQVGAESMQGWLDSYWWLTGNPQQYVRFRASTPSLNLYLLPQADESYAFYESTRLRGFQKVEALWNITQQEELSTRATQRLWLKRDYGALLEAHDHAEKGQYHVATRYGELVFPLYGDNKEYFYNSQLGLSKINQEEQC